MVKSIASPIAASHAYCRRVARRAKSSFPAAFQLLSPPKRRAMTALYAFMRVTDDLADEPGEVGAKRAKLRDWRTGLTRCLESGDHSHPVHLALAESVTAHAIPVRYLYDVLDGVEMDLEPVAFRHFGELYPYCYRVASAVGLACVPVWGLCPGRTLDQAAPAAEAAGIAFQLTNILRDVAEDQSRGRVYLPAEDLTAFGLTPLTWREPNLRPAFRALMHFQATRAHGYYDRAAELDALLSNEGRAIYGAMTRVYRGLLGEIERREYDVFAGRVRLSSLAKLVAVARAYPVRWGWL